MVVRKRHRAIFGDGTESFVLGMTEPTLFNTGVIPGVPRTTYSGPNPITTDGAILQNLDFPNLVTVDAANVSFYNCYFYGSYSGLGNGGILHLRDDECSNINVTRCTIKPTIPGDRYDGIYGHDYTATRCQILDTVDAFAVVSPFASAANVNIHGNYVGPLSWFRDDRGAHDDGTHNDGVQIHGGTDINITGNTFWGYRNNVNNETTNADGSPYQPRITNLILGQHTSQMVDNVTVENNFFWGGNNSVFLKSDRAGGLGGGYVGFDAVVRNNTWKNDDQADDGGAYHFYHIRTDDLMSINGINYPDGATLDTNGNRYSTATTVIDPARRGQLVYVRSVDR